MPFRFSFASFSLNRKSSTRVNTILDNVMYTEEVNFAYRVYSRSNTLFGQIFRSMKPLFAEIESYIESERGQLPCINLKSQYEEIKEDLDRLFSKLEAEAIAEAAKESLSKAQSKAASNAGSKRSSVNGAIVTAAGVIPFTPTTTVSRTRSRNSSRRGSFKDDARKKAALASALATSASLAAKAEISAATGTVTVTGTVGTALSGSSTAQVSRAPTPTREREHERNKSGIATPMRRSSDKSNISSPLQQYHQLTSSHHLMTSSPTLASGTSSPPIGFDLGPSASFAYSPPVALHPSLSNTSAAALSAQALAAAAEAAQAVEALRQLGDDSEEDEITPIGVKSGDDIFSKLLSASAHHQYPLPSSLKRSKPSTRPDSDFLSSYMSHHARSFHMFENLLDAYLECIMCAIVALALTETLQKKDLYANVLSELNTLASHFVRIGLPLTDRLLSIETNFVRENLFQLTFVDIDRGGAYSDARQCIRKCRLLHSLLAGVDIFIFPRMFEGHSNGVKCLSSSHLGPSEFISTAGFDESIRIWDIKRSKCLAQFIGHTSIVTWCQFSGGDEFIASASLDGTVKLWNTRSGECMKTLIGHTDGILDGDMGIKDKYIVTGSMDCSVRLWSTSNGRCIRILTGHRHWVKSVQFGDESHAPVIISAGLDKKLFIWNLKSGGGGGGNSNSGIGTNSTNSIGPKHSFTLPNYVLDMCQIGPDRILTTSKDSSLKVFDIREGKFEFDLSNPSASTAVTVGLSPDGSLIAAGLFDHTINIYDALKGGQLKRQLKVHNDGILCVKWIDNRTLVIGTANGNVQIINI